MESQDQKIILPSSGRVRSPLKLLAAIVICNLAGIIGSLITITGEGSWYAAIEKPSFNPPGFVFGPVWTTLYILMGISVYLIWMEGTGRRDVRVALTFFSVQLALNALWTFLFFGLQSPFLGLVEIIILWLFIIATIVAFYRINKNAAFFMVPYLAWVTFAAFLTYSIWILNG
ncbi:MAG: TspO/MBR family protein [Methanoregulaceae archaeon PtaB.Bin056]|jgi:tryptophan-rich sensory protein|nr:MAG: TspO/MBR family protein [Methanoregulaceae archaeon PtaB.Bin056]